MGLTVWRGVYYVPDGQLTLPPNNERVMHNRRPFVVLSEQKVCTDDSWVVVSGCPLSTSPNYVTEYDVEIPKSVCGKKSWARVHAFQPVLKTHLVEKIGDLPPNLYQDIMAKYIEHVGLY
ncbi:type II toxin-antitoxin system PemK/MazF family toxin [Rhodococcus tibetensis]|uniref:Type II toxin-antitoxin system PemK/MazF family toxin n=1 Tax=Rhodococcus tibetensis TaxID=2965064 RepID=A0ABT1QH36_9NOCA|nr:type II toxin-antitoxin system PemK/MazF family toxin [Rhodococcus sp. FXJ9.536]MCQ4120432.1 type II toxin-antitoxin system PemK/MazF family toxin [Rhodococcus sp. FXJ9.536]